MVYGLVFYAPWFNMYALIC